MRREQHDEEFTAFVEARRTTLLRTAYLLCGDWHRSEDLVQQVLVRIYRAWPRIGSSGGADAYVRRALVTANIDRWRWHARRPETLTATEPDSSYSPVHGVEDRALLQSALMQLTASQRRVIVLRYWLDLSVEQTASDLGVSAGTVKSQTSRALARLRVALPNDTTTTEALPRSTK